MAQSQKKTVESLSATDQSSIRRLEKQEDTRSRIANIFVCGYLAVLGLLILLSAFHKMTTDSTKDFLLAVGSPLGFIIGFYFKSSEK